MGPFILGILFGWLLEWLFFNFWIKGRSSNDSSGSTESSALKSELNSKNSIIADLKSKLEKAESNVKSVASSGTVAAATKAVSKTASSTKSTTTKNKSSANKSASATKKTSSTKTTTKAKPVAKKAVKKTSAKSTSTAKKPAQTKTKATTAKSKTTTKSSTVAKPAKKATAAKKPATRKISAKASGDDLTKLSGIGPSMALKLKDLGINSYSKLSEMDDDILRDMLEASGARLNNNKEAMDSWNEQAELAMKGDFAGLKKLQEELKK